MLRLRSFVWSVYERKKICEVVPLLCLKCGSVILFLFNKEDGEVSEGGGKLGMLCLERDTPQKTLAALSVLFVNYSYNMPRTI